MPALNTSSAPSPKHPSTTLRVSILLPTRNARDFLSERMESIIRQSVADWELIACDSHSDDGTWEYLETFTSDPRVHLHRVPMEGLYAGWNECLRRASGDYIYIATADDTMNEDCLEKLSRALDETPDADLALCPVDWIDEEGHPIPGSQREIHRFLDSHLSPGRTRISKESMFLMLASFSWGVGSVTGLLFRRGLLKRTGLFPTDLSFLGDAEWSLRASLATDFIWVADTGATWRVHSTQASKRFSLRDAWHFRQALRRVLDDPTSPIPDRWKEVPGWRKQLLRPRTLQAEMTTNLTLANIVNHRSRSLGWCIEAWKVSPTILLRRIASGFSIGSDWSRSATSIFSEWLTTFNPPWPPAHLQPEGTPTSAAYRTGDHPAKLEAVHAPATSNAADKVTPPESRACNAPHLLMVCTDFQEGGGGHLCLLRHARRLNASGIPTSLLAQELQPLRVKHTFIGASDFDSVHLIPRGRWFWPPLIYRLSWTIALRRFLVILEGVIKILCVRPDGILMVFNGSRLSHWSWVANKLRIPMGVIVYDLRELWADTPKERRRMHADTRGTLKRASILWFVSEELRAEYLRRVPELDPALCHILPPIPGRIEVPTPGWRQEFTDCTTITFAGGLKSSNHDVFRALMSEMRTSAGRLVIITQEKRLASLRQELQDYHDVLELRAIPQNPPDGIKWAAANSTCLLVHYSFDTSAEELSLTSFPSKLLEYSHLGLPILIAAPANTTVGKWAKKVNWPLWLDSLESARIQEALERLKHEDFWHFCVSKSRQYAEGDFCPDVIHENFTTEVGEMLGRPASSLGREA
nr:glycosyltransferase [Roseimicrobium gellanilyticum]